MIGKKEKMKTPNIDNYNVVRKDYVKHSRGGLAILIRTGISFTILEFVCICITGEFMAVVT